MFGGKTISHENFASFGLVSHRNLFSKRHVFDPNFFTKPSRHLFSGPNGLFGVFGGKIILHENFASFGLGSHRNRFSKNHVFDPNFFTKQHHSNYQGQTDYMARLRAKLFRSEVSYLWKNTFMGRIFLLNRPSPISGPNGLFGVFGGKTISHENFASFGLGSHRNRFSKKTRLRSEFFTKQHHRNYRGQTDYMARLVAKLFRSEVS